MIIAYRRLRHLVLPVALALGVLVPRLATAEEWVEPKFDPPVGSQWTIQRELNVQKVNGGIMVGHTLKEAALLTIAEKTADGFVVTYARQSSSYDGNPAGAAAQRLMFEAQQGLVIRIVTDAAGKPLRIENFDEVKAALKKAVAAQPASTANPDVLAAVRRVGDRILAVDNKRAAELFLDSLPVLAVAQNTGLKPGEMRKSTLPVANALVDGITKTLTLSIARTNPDAGTARYLMTETYDAEFDEDAGPGDGEGVRDHQRQHRHRRAGGEIGGGRVRCARAIRCRGRHDPRTAQAVGHLIPLYRKSLRYHRGRGGDRHPGRDAGACGSGGRCAHRRTSGGGHRSGRDARRRYHGGCAAAVGAANQRG